MSRRPPHGYKFTLKEKIEAYTLVIAYLIGVCIIVTFSMYIFIEDVTNFFNNIISWFN